MLALQLTFAVTSTVPAFAAAGASTVHVVFVVQFTEVPSVLPNVKAVAVVPRPNPLPLTLTSVPPAVDPVLGLRPVPQSARTDPALGR